MTELLDRRSAQGRRALATVTLGSGIALLDGTVVNIAARTIGEDLDASLAQVQWVLNGYLLSLASLILVGGALGDRFGRRRMYVAGVAGFGLTSLLCALAQTPGQLIGLRVLQGVAGALLTPGGLAIIQGSFRREDRAPAIGTWAGLAGIATAVGPFIGGLLVEHAGWRWIFAINLPLCLLVLWLSRAVPESRDDSDDRRLDVPGAVCGVLALGASTQLLTTWRVAGSTTLVTLFALAVAGFAGFLALERRPGAMAPLSMFADRVFAAANLMTLLVYGALGAVTFLLVLQLQVSADFSALEAGLATLPITVAMLLLSTRAAALAAVIGPRVPMTFGPLVCAAGVLWLAGIGADAHYWSEVFPGMVLFGLGLAGLVSPLTSAVLAAAPDRLAGTASGVNNAVARAGSLLAVAALPAAVGLSGGDWTDPVALTDGYRAAQMLCAALLAAGGVVSWFGLAVGKDEAHE